jgi:hypothetical protein
VVLEKGGNVPVAMLTAKVADEVAHRAVAQAELLGDVGHGPTVHEIGSQDFVAALQDLVGLEKELLVEQVVHDLTSESVTGLIRESAGNGNGIDGVGTRPSRGFTASPGEKTAAICVEGSDLRRGRRCRCGARDARAAKRRG